MSETRSATEQPPPSVSRPAGIDRFLFAPIDARAAAFMRIAMAIAIPWFFWSTHLRVMPPAQSIPGAEFWYHHLFLTRKYAGAIIVFAALFGMGIRPRLTGLVLFALLLPLDGLSRGRQSRQVMLTSLLAFSFVRSNARLSLRVWPNRRPPGDAGPIWPIRLMQIQLSLVYAVNAFAKFTPHFLSGQILVGMSRMRPNFLIDMSDGHAHLGPIAMPVALAAVGAVVVETYLAVGFWFRKARWFTAALGVTFHITLQSIVRIFMLDLASMFLYLSFLLPWTRDDSPDEKPTGDSC